MYSETLTRSLTLYELLGRMQTSGSDEKVAFGELLRLAESRGFGPMLAVPAFISATPIGAIPGIPTVTGITIFLISLQVLLSKSHPWLPSAIKNINIDKDSLNAGITKMKPAALQIDRFLFPRWLFIRQPLFRILIALTCACCGIFMIPLELVPFMGLIPAFAVLIMAIGMATDDGAVALLGLSLALFGLTTAGYQFVVTAS
ncbi:exopolysaccharide biosynthesis protein [Alteromonas sp. ASW11-130]|uniref:exopolysaccharide biosynthesis protein n=1 Tax=Alteromonas sp. ASW11-130 TaxID=3015775 RepID=UPI0022422FAD|nr:exopolysaccharide biosynthesis protein [Alteromonas sp. ASW11-130]MCW8090277.1 exopolysaccharide biosynthesis protein [Alteromonas sp. ASW11-130]